MVTNEDCNNMKSMVIKKILTLLLCSVTALSVVAETKTVQRSSKKAPEWVGNVADGYLIVSVRSKNLAEAQDDALRKIRESIISAVAANVTIKERSASSEIYHNGDIESVDKFTKETAVNAANLPYLKDITLSKAEDVYWEKKVDKATKEEFYDYAVKYPFSSSERRKLVREFEELDAKNEAELNQLEEGFASVASSAAISESFGKLEALQKYFFDDIRASKVKSLQQRYKELPKEVTAYGEFVAPGVLVCGLQLNGNRFSVPSIRNIKTNCARIVSTTPDEGQFRIEFDYADCLPDEVNTIMLEFAFNNRRLNHTFHLAEMYNKDKEIAKPFSVIPQGKIFLTADSASVEKRTVTDIHILMTVNNKDGHEFGVKSIEMNVPEMQGELVVDNVDSVFSTAGQVTINILAKGQFRIAEKRSSSVNFINGAITIVNPTNEKLERLRFTLPYSANWNK